MKFFQKSKQLVEKKPGKKMMIAIAGMLLIAIIVSGIGIYLIKADAEGMENGEGQLQEMEAAAENANSFTEEGTTTMGTVSQMPEFSLNRALMYVEEVYVEAGSTVAEGDALFKIAEDTLKEAQLAYESGKLDASYIKLDAETTAESAESTLEDALAELEEDIEAKYKKWQDTAYAIAAYNDNFYNNIYYTKAGVPEKEAAVTTAQAAYDEAQAAYEASGINYEAAKSSFDTAVAELAAVTAGTSESGMTMEQAATAVVNSYNTLSTVEPLYDTAQQAAQELQQAKQELELAKSTYEKTEEQAEKTLEQLEANVDALKQNYETASREAETRKLELQKTYETSLLEGEYAETTYNETVEKLKSAVEKAEDTLADLKEEQKALLSLENGVVCANQSGTLASVTYDAEDILFSGTAFVTYYDTSTLTISVEVEQENIAKIAVGDEVRVTVSGSRRDVTGTVASIASAATTGRSVSDVTYAVVISIENENNMLSAGSSATVTFEYGE